MSNLNIAKRTIYHYIKQASGEQVNPDAREEIDRAIDIIVGEAVERAVKRCKRYMTSGEPNE
jgi:hypothetical protein